MIRRWLARRRFQRECPHPPERVSGHPIEHGRKSWYCARCEKCWIT